jgi:hypothetical protein
MAREAAKLELFNKTTLKKAWYGVNEWKEGENCVNVDRRIVSTKRAITQHLLRSTGTGHHGSYDER